MNMKLVAVAATALAAGAAIGWFAKPASASAADVSGETAKSRKIAEPPATDSEKALRARIKELELALARKNAKHEAVPALKTREETVPRHGINRRDGDKGILGAVERMKKEDPERYSRMTNRVETFRRMRAERNVRKLAFLSSIDTSGMSADAKAVHERLQESMAARESIENRLHSMENPSESEMRGLFEQMHEADREVRELSMQERENLLRQTTDALGFSGDDAEQIISTVKEIFDSTENGFDGMRPHHRGGRRGGGGRGNR